MSIQAVIQKMRVDFPLAQQQLEQIEVWPPEEIAEFRAGSKRAVDAGDEEIILCWAGWIGQLADDMRGRISRCEQINRAIRNDIAMEKAAA